MDNWYVPITLLPSVGFFIVATTSIANALSAEIARLIELGRESQMDIISRKVQQLRLVSIALALLYASAGLLAVAGLIAGLDVNLMLELKSWVVVLVCLSIGIFVLATGALMVYALRAVRIKEAQYHNM